NQLCGFELKFRRKMFTHEVTYRVGEVRISPPIRWPVSVCHYTRKCCHDITPQRAEADTSGYQDID
ncbi:hypothetical protein, partial [Sodalis sp. (in: enterobacteria)]|uniref:hypothetical protein n=1 Tax=Sodalis sp. (in: enterobacteria) TaxID=1898979 RepID=UPI003F2FD206